MADLPATGDILAQRYRIDELIGQGGMGAVFRATQLGLMRAVAVKVLLPERTGPRVRERFEREAKVAAALRHSGAVEVYDFGVDPQQRLYLVMELLLGQPFTRHIGTSGMDISFALEVMAQTADVLVAAHNANMVHRDIKPDNLFCVDRADGAVQVKVVDFGLAFIKDGGDLGRLTSNDVIAGTPQYMAPEQCRGQAVDAPADVYALGCVLFDALTGEPPFRGSAGELLAQHIHVPPPRLSSRRADVPSGLSSLVDDMLHKDPRQRPTAQAVATGLRALARPGPAKNIGRAARAIAPAIATHRNNITRAETPTLDVPGTGSPQSSASCVFVAGGVDDALYQTMAINGFTLTTADAIGPRIELWLYASLATIKDRIAQGHQVVAGADPDDMERFSQLMRAGVAEVVPLPAEPIAIVAKLTRTLKRMSP
jgi:eukaryotic-like serine/threonine-protein kinase